MQIEERMNEFAENMEFLEGLDKLEYVVDMAKQSPGLPTDAKTEPNKVQGCMSETWILVGGTATAIQLSSDSEAQIVKGMLHMFAQSINGHSREEILAIDEQTVLDKLGLGGSITNKRINGFASAVLMVKSAIKKL